MLQKLQSPTNSPNQSYGVQQHKTLYRTHTLKYFSVIYIYISYGEPRNLQNDSPELVNLYVIARYFNYMLCVHLLFSISEQCFIPED